MSKKARRIVKRVTALFLALTIVMSFALTRSSERVLHATALDEEESAGEVRTAEEVANENLDLQTESLSIPADTEPAPAEEPEQASGENALFGAVQEPEQEGAAEEAGSPETDSDAIPDAGEETGEETGEQTQPSAEAGEETKEEEKAEEETETAPEEEPGEETAPEEEAASETEEEQPEAEEEPEEEAPPEYWTVTFLDRDNQTVASVPVEKGAAIGELPDPIYREDYIAYWAVGSSAEGPQGTVWTPVSRIGAGFVPEADVTAVPDYDKVTYTVTFYADASLDAAGKVAERTVDVDTSYSLNDIPPVPALQNYTGRWAYGGGAFDNTVSVREDTSVWAVYDQQVFQVRFLVNGESYEEDTCYSGDALRLPADPVLAGKTFRGWTADGRTYAGGEAVRSDLTLEAVFADQIAVRFIIRSEDSGMPSDEVLTQYFDSDSAVITTLPQTPFVADKVFDKWVVQGTDTEVTAGTAVTSSMTAVAVFRPFEVYTLTASYYYLSNKNEKINFETQIIELDSASLPYTLHAPSSTKTDEDKVKGAPIYYPETLTLELQKTDFTDKACSVEIQYLPGSAEYYFVYELKNLTGNGYTEIPDTREKVTGVIGSYVSPTVKDFDNAVPETVGAATISQTSGQELTVRYVRKNYTLSYETNGGSYVSGVTAPYGTKVALSTAAPVRDGYTFSGWYTDEGLKTKAPASLELKADATLYAKWEGKKVNYTIVYLFEKYNETGTASAYVYDNSAVGQAVVGSVVTPSTSGIPDKSRTGWEKDAERNGSSSAVIEADGSTVLYVYYRLKTYTFLFHAGSYSSYAVTAKLKDGTTGTGTLSYKIQVKLGQDISGTWPVNVTGTYTRSKTTYNVYFNGWKPSTSSTRYVTKRTSVTPDMLPTSGDSITYTAQWANAASEYTVNYWLQNAEDDNYTNSEVYSQTYTSSSGNLSAKEISGYTYHHGNSGAQNTKQYDFYYNRDTFRIDYFDGDEKVKTVSNVKFDADISADAYTAAPANDEHAGLYAWGGWYADAGLTTPYSFDTMPASNLALYAKWIPPQYTVSFVLNGGTGEAPDQVLELGKKVIRPENPVRTGYVFDGWYTDGEDGELYDWQRPVSEDLTLAAKWNNSLIRYTVHYLDTDGKTLVPDRVVTNPNNGVGTVVTEQAVTVAGHRPDEGSKSLTLGLEGNEITFIYSGKTEKTSYTVRYLLEGTDFAVAEEKSVGEVDGNTLSVLEKAAAVNYAAVAEAYPEYRGLELHPDAVQKELILGADESKNVLTFVYSSAQSVEITVRYTDMEGNEIPGVEADSRIVKMGSSFTLNRQPIIGWELAAAVEGTSLSDPAAKTDYTVTAEKAKNGSLDFTLFYQKKLIITAVSDRKQYDGKALTLPAEITGQVEANGLMDGDSLAGIGLRFTQQDGSEAEPENGRLNAGVCVVTPCDAVIAGKHTGNDYYSIRFISGTLEVTRISVSVRIEPDRWTNATYTGEGYRTGFTNPDKTVSDYVRISHAGYAEQYLDAIWAAVLDDARLRHDAGAPGLGYVAIENSDAGDYSFTLDMTSADLPKDSNYSVALYVRPGRLQILPAEIRVSTGSAEKTYDGTALTSAEASLSGLVNGETATVVTTGAQTGVGQSPNTCVIRWDGSARESNYKLKEEDLGTLTVTASEIRLAVNDRALTYSGAEQSGWELTEEIAGTGEPVSTDAYTVSGLAEGQTLSVSGYVPAHGTNAGSYANGSFADAVIRITDAEGGDVTSCYRIAAEPGSLSIAKAKVTVAANSLTKTYGEADPALTVSLSGDLAEGDESLIRYSISRAPGEDAGKYGIMPYGEREQGNYLVDYSRGTLTVEAAEMNAQAISVGKTYDGTPAVGGAAAGTYPDDGNTVLEYSLDGGATWTDTAPELVNAGELSYLVRISNPNYVTAVIEGVLEIARREVTVTAQNSVKVFGSEDPVLTAEVSGVLDGDPAIEYTLSRKAGENVGNYPIKAEGEEEQGNYRVRYADAVFAITRSGSLRLTPTGYEGVYDGNSHRIGAAVNIQEGTELRYSTDGGATWTETVPGLTDVGEQTVLIEASNPNYDTVSAEASVRITPLAVTVRANDAGKIYLEEDPELTASVTGLLSSDMEAGVSVLYTLEREEGENAGTYVIRVKAGEAQGNYVVGTVDGTFTVSPAETVVRAVSASKTYDGAPLNGAAADEPPEGTAVSYSTDGGETWTEEVPGITHTGVLNYLLRAENPNYRIPDAAGTLTVNRSSVTVTAVNAAKTYGAPDPEFTAQISGGLVAGEKDKIAYSFSREGGEDAGTYPVQVSGSEVQGDYVVTYAPGVLTISRAGTLTVSASGFEGPYDGETHEASASASVEQGTVLSYSTDGGATWSGTVPGILDAGEQKVLVRAENANYEPAETEVTLRVYPRAVLLTAASATREYNGSPLSDGSYSQTGSFAGDEGTDIRVSGSQTLPGSSENVLTYELRGNTKRENYSISVVNGILAVTNRSAKYEISLVPSGGSFVYDGQQHSVSGFETQSFVIGDSAFTVDGVSAGASMTDAGRAAVTVQGTPRVLDAAGNDVTGQFIVNLESAVLAVRPRSLVFRSASATAEYNGSALTAGTVAVEGEGFAGDEGAEFTVTGSQTLAGSSENSFTWTLKSNTRAENYSISSVPGTLTVTNRNAPYAIEVVAESASAVYDGREHRVTALKSTTFGIEGRVYRVTGLEACGAGVHADTYAVNVTGTPVVTDSEGNDVTAQFSVTAVPGTLTIRPRALLLTSAGAVKPYDAIPLTAYTVRVSEPGFAEGDGASYHFTGSRTVVGSAENSFSYTFNEGTIASDYEVTVNFGTLTVTARPEDARFEVNVRAGSGSALYDGAAHTVDAVSLDGESVTGGGALRFTRNGESFTLTGLRAQRTETNAGSYEVNVTGTPFITDSAGNNVTDQFVVVPVNGSLRIRARSVTMTSGSAEHAYNGRELRNSEVTVGGDGFAEGEGASYSVTGARTLVGETRNDFSYALNPGTLAANYEITRQYGILRVKNRDARFEITMRANSAEVLYQGVAQTAEGFENTRFSMNGVNYTVTGLSAYGSGTDAGSYPVNVRGTAKVLDADGNDVTAQFTVSVEPGTLKIRPRSVTLTSATDSRPYDGRPFQNTDVTVGGDGFADGEGAETYSFASRILVGSTENSFLWTLNAGTKEQNYLVTPLYGRLNVTSREALYEITLKPNSDESFFYDGAEHSVGGFETTEFEIDGNVYTVVDVTAEVTASEPGTYPTVITGEPRVLDADGNDVTDQFAVSIENGYLTIHDTYVLTVRFADSRYRGGELPDPKNDLAPAYAGRYAPGESFGPVRAPEVAGYTPEYREIRSDAAGMPEHDLTLVIFYEADAVPVIPAPVDPGQPEEPQDKGTEDEPQDEPAEEEPWAPIGVAVPGGYETGELVAVEDPQIPLAGTAPAYWALVNLILALLTLLLTILLAVVKFAGRDESEDGEAEAEEASGAKKSEPGDREKQRISVWMLFLSLLVTVISAVVFILTEDLSNSMALVDRWTLLMVLIFAVQLLVSWVAGRRRDDGEETPPQAENA